MSETAALPPKGDTSFFRPRRLGHANLFIGDYERAGEYYVNVVGFREVYRQPDNMATFVSNGNTYHDLGLTDIRSKYARQGQKPGLWHLAFELETEVDLVAGYRRAIASGVKFDLLQDHDVAHSLYQTDPDGLMVEIYADVVKDWRAARHGIIIKEKPEYVPGVSSPANTERNYPQDPEFDIVKEATFHPKKVTHVALVALRYEDMFRFYAERVGLSPLVGDERTAFAVLKGTHSYGDLTLYRHRPGLTPGFHHVGFEVWDEADLAHSVNALRATGGTIERDIDHPARHSVCLRDPDGLLLQFHVNRDWRAPKLAAVDAETALYLL